MRTGAPAPVKKPSSVLCPPCPDPRVGVLSSTTPCALVLTYLYLVNTELVSKSLSHGHYHFKFSFTFYKSNVRYTPIQQGRSALADTPSHATLRHSTRNLAQPTPRDFGSKHTGNLPSSKSTAPHFFDFFVSVRSTCHVDEAFLSGDCSQ